MPLSEKIMKISLISLLSIILLSSACSLQQPKRNLSSVYESESLDIDSFAIDDEDDEALSKLAPAKETIWARWFNKKVGFFNNPDHVIAYDLIKIAKKTIDIEIYEMKDPKFRDLLLGALKRGVKIRIIKDSNTVADSCDELSDTKELSKPDCMLEKAYVHEILGLGAQYVYFNKMKLCAEEGKRGCFQHGKMIIVDSRFLLLSTGNFNSSSFCNLDTKPSKCNRDYSYVTKNKKVIHFLESVFNKDITRERWDMKSGIASGNMGVTVSPFSQPRLVSLIKSAKKSVIIQNQYLEEPAINEAINEKAAEGIEVKVMVSDFCNYGRPTASKKKKTFDIYSSFDRSGVKTKIFTPQMKINGKAGYLHAKAIVIDGRLAWIGSVNGSLNSTSKNREFGIIFKTKKAVKKLLKVMNEDFNHPRSTTWEKSLSCEKPTYGEVIED